MELQTDHGPFSYDSHLNKVMSFLGAVTGARSQISNIVDAVERDHVDLKRFIKLLKNESTPAFIKRKIFPQFASLLASHSSSEEKAMYTISQTLPGLKQKTLEGLVEHSVATKLLKSIALDPVHKELSNWTAQVQVLAELVEHHVQEEESDLLPEIKKEMNKKAQLTACQKFIKLRRKSQKNVTKENAGILSEAYE